MLSAVPSTVQTTYIQRATSHESIITGKSFSEEVADALNTRAKNLGNSHPSIILGKERRLMEGLMHVAEAVRTAEKEIKRSSPPCHYHLDSGSTQRHTEVIAVGETNKQLRPEIQPGDCEQRDTSFVRTQTQLPTTKLSPVMPLRDNGNASLFAGDTWSFTEPHGIPRESSPIHMRLAHDSYVEHRRSMTGCFGLRYSKSSKSPQRVSRSQHTISRSQQSVSPRKIGRPNLFSKKNRENLRNIIQAKMKKQPKVKPKKQRNEETAENHVTFGNRIRSVIGRNCLKTARKRGRSVFSSGLKRTEDTYGRIKKCFVTKFGD